MDRDIILFIGPVGSGKSMVRGIMGEFFREKLKAQGGSDEIQLHFINEFEHLKQIAEEDEAQELHKMVSVGKDGEETFEITNQKAYEMM